MKDALAIHRMLLEREAPHEIVRLPRAIANADELHEVLRMPAVRCLATRVYSVQPVLRPTVPRGFRTMAAMVNQAGAGGTPEAVRSALGARSVRQASADIINKTTDYAAELVAPLLLPQAMPLFIDEAIVEALGADDIVYTATGEPRIALAIPVFDLLAITGAKPVKAEATGDTPNAAWTQPPRPQIGRGPRMRASRSRAR
jgi:hypothetical protein